MLMNADALDDAERGMDGLRADAEADGMPELIAGAHWQQAQIAYQRGELARCELEAPPPSRPGATSPAVSRLRGS